MSPDGFRTDPIKEDEQDKIKQGVSVKIKKDTKLPTKSNDNKDNYRKG